MHTKRGFCLGWLNTDTFLEKCEGGFPVSKKKIHIKIIYLKLYDEKNAKKVALHNFWGDLGGAIIVFFL